MEGTTVVDLFNKFEILVGRKTKQNRSSVSFLHILTRGGKHRFGKKYMIVSASSLKVW